MSRRLDRRWRGRRSVPRPASEGPGYAAERPVGGRTETTSVVGGVSVDGGGGESADPEGSDELRPGIPRGTRRELLAALATGGTALTLGSVLLTGGSDPGRRGGQGPAATPTEESTPEATESPTAEPTEEPPAGPPGSVDVRSYGAAVDGRTDDTAAVMRAIAAAAPDGTVWFPPGELRLRSPPERRAALLLDESHGNVHLLGSGAGPEGTRLVLAPEHAGTHRGIHLVADSPDTVRDITVENLTLDGNKAQQGGGPGIGIETDEGRGTFTLLDCRVTAWVNSGVRFGGGMDAEIQYCRFDNNGLSSNGGHDISPNQTRPTTTRIRNVLCENSGGASIDVGRDIRRNIQTVLIDRCILRNSRGSVKVSAENRRTTVRRTQMLGDASTTIPVKRNPSDVSLGALVLEDCLIDGAQWPACDLPAPGKLELHDVAIRNVDQGDFGRGMGRGGIFAEGVDFGASGAVSIHDVGLDGDGVALNLTDCSGTIDQLSYGRTGGLGSHSGVTIRAQVEGAPPLEPDVVDEASVGPRSR